MVFPHALDELRARDHLARQPHEMLEQPEFARSEFDLTAPARDFARHEIHHQVADLVQRDRLAGHAPHERADPRDHLVHGKWFRHVVIRAQVQALDALVHFAARRDDHHRGRHLAHAQHLQHAEAVALREHDVYDDRVVGRLGRPLKPVLTVATDVHCESHSWSPFFSRLAIFASSSMTSSFMSSHLDPPTARLLGKIQ